jgi:outer membrane lipoprotein-sorting protein
MEVYMKKIFGIFLFAGMSAALWGQTPDVNGIVARFDANRIFDTSETDAAMSVQNNLGTTAQSLRTYSRRNGDTLIEITGGPDRGQKVLRLAQSVYLYYPDAEQVIRIQGASLKDSMFGSSFSYEDLTGDRSTSAAYNTEYQGRETIDGVDCYILMCTAKKRTTVYQKVQYYVAVNEYYAKRTVIFSASGLPIRQIDGSDVRVISGNAIPFRQTVTDLLNRKNVTVMEIRNIKINQPIPSSYFSRDRLSW